MARAVEDNWCAAWASLGALQIVPRTLVDDRPEYLRVCTPGVPEMLLNIVLRYSADGGSMTQAELGRVIAPFRQHRLPFQWWLTLGAEPAGLRDQLRLLGMQSWGGSTSMALELDGWRPRYRRAEAGVHLHRVSTPDEGREALRVICDVFYVPSGPMARWTTENPAFAVYAGRFRGRTVAALATLQRDDVVGVYHVATLAGARQRGIAGNLLILALREAQAAGCTQATLTATPEARHLYEQLGFRTCGLIEQWVPGHALASALARGQLPYGDDLYGA
jgi:ribosomal protein S18 acetylase RimI-like enzyme